MKEIVLILDAATINLAADVCTNLPECQVYIFDPVLVDKLPIGQFGNVELITAFSGPEYRLMHRNALAAASELEDQFERARVEAGCEISVLGWRTLSYYYFFMLSQWYSALREWLGTRLAGRRLHIFTGDHPAEFYFDSFLPPALLISYLSVRGVECVSHNYTNSQAVIYPVFDLRDLATEDMTGAVLIHLPTCMYDNRYFFDELRAVGRRLINFRSQHWDVAMDADWQRGLTDPESLLETFDVPTQAAVSAFTATMRSTAARVMLPFFDISNFRAQQSEHFAMKYRSQLISYFGLQRSFDRTPLSRLVISNHDTGLHGPLIAFAAQRGLPVMMLPHSKVGMDIEFRYANLSICTHPIQGQPIRDPDERVLDHHSIRYPEVFRGSSTPGGSLRVVSLLLNDMSLSGMLFAPTEAYLAGIGQMVEWAKRNDVALKVRVRPGGSIIRLLGKLFGMDPVALRGQVDDSMEDYIKGCDICLMYQMPTSAYLHFLRNSVPILNPVVSSHVGAPFALLHPDLIRPESVPTTLSRLDRFIADPSSMHEFSLSQFSSYVNLFQRAKPLRTLLVDSPRGA